MKPRGLILAAGMPRSGSTWLYNAVRLLARESAASPTDVACAWVGDSEKLPDARVRILKIHDFAPELAEQANCIVYSYRDVRDAMASMARKFETQLTLDLARHLIRQHSCWCSVANYVMRYEQMVLDPEAELHRLQTALGLNEIEVASVLKQLSGLDYDSPGSKNETYHSENLFHRGHITDGRVGSWGAQLSAELEGEIVAEDREWFERFGLDAQAS